MAVRGPSNRLQPPLPRPAPAHLLPPTQPRPAAPPEAARPAPAEWPPMGTMGHVSYPTYPPAAGMDEAGSHKPAGSGTAQPKPVANPPQYRPQTPPDFNGAVWRGYAPANNWEAQAMPRQTAEHERLVGPNKEGLNINSHTQTHDSDAQPLRRPIQGPGPTESGQVFVHPQNGRRPLESLYGNPNAGGSGMNQGRPSSLGALESHHPDAAVSSHVHPWSAGDEPGLYVPSPTDYNTTIQSNNLGGSTQTPAFGRRTTDIVNTPARTFRTENGGLVSENPQYQRLGYDRTTGQNVYHTLVDKPASAKTAQPVSPSQFTPPPPGTTDYPAGPPGPFPKVYPAGPDHVSNRPDVTGPLYPLPHVPEPGTDIPPLQVRREHPGFLGIGTRPGPLGSKGANVGSEPRLPPDPNISFE
jgi:hypothetical protein